MAALKNILILDGQDADRIIGAMGIIQQHPDDRASTNRFADSCEPIARKHSLTHRERIKPLARAGRKRWTGEDPPSHEDKSIRQLSEEEAQIGPEELAARAIIRHPALRTIDNLQLYCFRDRFAYRPGQEEADPNGQNPNYLEYWIRRLNEQLDTGEKLDAVIIPSNIGPLEYKKLETGLARLKREQPDVKIILVQQRVSVSASNPPLVDYVVSRSRVNDAIRDCLEVPQLPIATAEDMRNLNIEASRERHFQRGGKVADLPHWLVRIGDPQYQPPGGDDKGGRKGRG